MRSIFIHGELVEDINAREASRCIDFFEELYEKRLENSPWLHAIGKCKAPYLDLIWSPILSDPELIDALQSLLIENDTVCKKAIENLSEEEKGDLCKIADYVKKDNQESSLIKVLEHAHVTVHNATCNRNVSAENEINFGASLGNFNQPQPNALRVDNKANLTSSLSSSSNLLSNAFLGAAVGSVAIVGIGFWAFKKFKTKSTNKQFVELNNDEKFSLKLNEFKPNKCLV